MQAKQLLIVAALLVIAGFVSYELWQRFQPDPTAKQLNDSAETGKKRLCEIDPKYCK